RRPGDVELDVALTLGLVLLHLLAERTHGTLAEYGKRDALADHALGAAVGNQCGLGVIQHVDESGRYGEPGRIDFLTATGAAQIAARDDPIALDGHVLNHTGHAGPVVDGSMPDDEVVLRRPRACADRKQEKQDDQSSTHGA